jgi:hypothetical protein
MGITLKKVVENINTLSNKQNSKIITNYHNKSHRVFSFIMPYILDWLLYN